jgi:hypothetical protein
MILGFRHHLSCCKSAIRKQLVQSHERGTVGNICNIYSILVSHRGLNVSEQNLSVAFRPAGWPKIPQIRSEFVLTDKSRNFWVNIQIDHSGREQGALWPRRGQRNPGNLPENRQPLILDIRLASGFWRQVFGA